MTQAGSIDFAMIFQHAPVGLCVSHQRVITACNDALATIFGYSAAELTGQSFSILYPTMDEFERTGARIAPILNQRGHYSDERIMKRANGELFWCHVTGRALSRDDPHAAAIWSFEDLASQRPVTAALTPREREIAALLVAGGAAGAIAGTRINDLLVRRKGLLTHVFAWFVISAGLYIGVRGALIFLQA